MKTPLNQNEGRQAPAETRRPARGRLSAFSVIALCVLLAAPGYALSRLTANIDWRILPGVALAMSIFAFLAYRSDKRRAEAGEWRISEATLHVIALLGGWPGAFVGQRVFRHKTAKLPFQVVFWMIVLGHQFVAVDSLLEWRLTKETIRAVKAQW